MVAFHKLIFMKAIILVVIIIFFIGVVSGAESKAETTPIYPGMGFAPVEQLTNMYPTVKNNATIMEYINECGVGSFHEEQMNANFKSVHLSPANSCGKKLVFAVRKSAGRDDPTRIAQIWIFGSNETWSIPLEYAEISDNLSNSKLQPPSKTPITPGFGFTAAIAALILIGIVFPKIKKRDP